MYNNIGGKIQILAIVLCVLGIIACVITGIVFLVEEWVGPGILIMIVGSLLSWVSSFFLYGFGQLIENSDILVDYARKAEKSARLTSAHRETATTQSTATAPAQYSDLKKKIKATGTPTLEHILQNPNAKNLYSPQEFQLMQEELQARKNAQK